MAQSSALGDLLVRFAELAVCGVPIQESERVADKLPYVAYGSNLNISQMDKRCPGAQPVSSGKVKDYELVFRKSKSGCYLSVDPVPGKSADVALWDLSLEDERALDRQEGYPRYYQKVVVPVVVQTEEGPKTAFGFAYLLPSERPEGPCSQEYLERVRAGYAHFGFDEASLLQAYDRACLAAQERGE